MTTRHHDQEDLADFAQAWRETILPALVPNENGCLIWMGAKSGKGYGLVSLFGRNFRASRIALSVARGELLGSLHTCDNPPCCNPAHLFAGTKLDNHRDAVAKGRQTIGVAGIQKWRGESHGRAKLTEASVREIRALLGVKSKAEIGRAFGVGRTAIVKIAARQRWAHVT